MGPSSTTNDDHWDDATLDMWGRRYLLQLAIWVEAGWEGPRGEAEDVHSSNTWVSFYEKPLLLMALWFFFLRSSPMRCKNFFPKWMKIRLNGKQRLSGRRGWVRPSLTKDDDGRKPLEGVNCSKHECNWKSFEFSSPIRMLDFFFVFRSSSVALSSSLRRWEWTQTLDTPSQLLSKLFFHA